MELFFIIMMIGLVVGPVVQIGHAVHENYFSVSGKAKRKDRELDARRNVLALVELEHADALLEVRKSHEKELQHFESQMYEIEAPHLEAAAKKKRLEDARVYTEKMAKQRASRLVPTAADILDLMETVGDPEVSEWDTQIAMRKFLKEEWPDRCSPTANIELVEGLLRDRVERFHAQSDSFELINAEAQKRVANAEDPKALMSLWGIK